MKKLLGSLLLLYLLSSSFLLSAQSDPWAIKKQRKETGQEPSFQYRTRNGSQHSSARQQASSALLPPYGLKVKGGTAQEPPREIRGTLPVPTGQNARVTPDRVTPDRTAADLPTAASTYLKAVAPVMQISAPPEEFVPQQQWKDSRGQQHLRMQQQFRGVPVYGSEIIVHANGSHIVQGLNGRYMPTPQSLNTTPSVAAQEAIQSALSQLQEDGGVKSLSEAQKKLLRYEGPEAQLLILPEWEAGEPRLAWKVMVRPNMLDHWELLIDAQTSELIRKTNLTCSFVPDIYLPKKGSAQHASHSHSHASPRPATAPTRTSAASQGSGLDLNGIEQVLQTWQVGNAFGLIDASKDMFASDDNTSLQDLEGVLITYDAERKPNPESVGIVNSTNNVFSDPAAVSAHYNASMAYDFYRQNFQRLAINGQGGNILSIVNFVDEDGEELDNAFWNGTFMVYGNGNFAFTPLAGGLDVGGHEMTHGVIDATANLVYRNQSGAINEHIADVFGVLIEAEDYLLGEDVVLQEVYQSGAMRDMETPHNGGSSLNDIGWQPDHISEIYTGEEDNGGVHINSGIPNRAFFLFASEVGQEKAGEIYYHALTNYLTASSEFVDLRSAIINSAGDLYGDAEVQAASAAFDAVGITDTIEGENPDEGEELPTIEGNDFLLTVNTDPGDENSLYLINVDAEEFEPISVTSIQRKPTVTDDGSLAFFITEDETIRAIELTPPYNEESISDEALWSNLSISKDGKRLALISNQELPEIWVADLTRETDNVMKFELYNPTTQEDITTGEVQYADAIEWDYSGEYLIYDAYNQVQGLDQNFGDGVEYWDVGYIRVWDNTANDFGDGKITKLFTNLPQGTNIGNPSFSKTNRNIVCFDLFDKTEETYYIITADLSTGDVHTVYQNNTLGFPSYSSDDRFMVFDILDGNGRPAMGQIALNEDKLTPASALDTPYVEAQWTSWFRQGSRVINSPEKDLLSYELLVGDSTEVGTIDGESIEVTVAEGVDITDLRASFDQSTGAEVYVGEFRQISGVTSNDFSEDVVYTVIAQDGSVQNYTVHVEVEEIEDPVTGIGDEEETAQPLVFPNPFEQELRLNRPLREGTLLSLTDVLGRTYALEAQGNQLSVAEPLPAGVYFLRIQTKSNTQTVRLLRK